MKLALFYITNFTDFTKSYIKSEKYIIHWLNFMSNLFENIRVEGARISRNILKGEGEATRVWEPLLYSFSNWKISANKLRNK
jgi:hypothetical protein